MLESLSWAQISACIQRKLSGTWKVSSVCLDHVGQVPNPEFSKFYPCFRGISTQEAAIVTHLSKTTLLQRRQLVALASSTLERFINAKDISNILSKDRRDELAGASETVRLLNQLRDATGWEVDIKFCDREVNVPESYFFIHDSWIRNSRRWPDVIIIDGTYKVRLSKSGGRFRT